MTLVDIRAIQSRLLSLAERHSRDLRAIQSRAGASADALYRHLPAAYQGERVFEGLRAGLAQIVEAVRRDAGHAGALHSHDELRAIVGDRADGLSVNLGADPKSSDVSEYVDNAVSAARDATASAEDFAAAFAGTAYRAATIIESESTNQYQRARAAATEALRRMSAAEAAAHGFAVARSAEEFRDVGPVETRDDQTWLPLIGERWSAAGSACERCASADGEIRPFGFSFSLPGPTAHARCNCIRTLWAVAIPVDRAEADMDTRSSGGMLRAYTPIEERARGPRVDRAARTVEVIASTEAWDSYGTRLLASGWDLSRYLANPVVLACHDSHSIGSIVAKCVSIRLEGRRLAATLQFRPEGKSALSDETFELYADGFLRGVSVGFLPQDWVEEEMPALGPGPGKGSAPPKRMGRTYTRQQLAEISCVPVPANAEALARQLREFGSSPRVPRDNQADSPPKGKSKNMADESDIRALPPELAALLGVSGVDEAVQEISKRDLQADEATKRASAAEQRAMAAEKALSDRVEAEATSLVDGLVSTGRISREKRGSAFNLAKADPTAFRDMYPAEAGAPATHLLRQVSANASAPRPNPGLEAHVSGAGSAARPGVRSARNPIVEIKDRLLAEAHKAGRELSDSDAFNAAFAEYRDTIRAQEAAL